jgi:hypothetical protein
MGEVGRTDQFQHCESADDVIMSIVKGSTLGYVSLFDEKQNAKLAAATKADLVMGISIKAGYAMYNGLSIGGIGGGQANMRLTATVCLADANGKLVRRSVVYGQGTETALIGSIGAIGMGMDPAQFPRLIVSAQEDLLKNLAKEFASW